VKLNPKEHRMSSAPNRLLDDVARLMTDAAGAAQGLRREAETVVKSQIERLLRDMDMVSREEFDAMREMVLIAREENDKLSARIAALESRLDAAAPAEPAAKAKKAVSSTAKAVKSA
jgi:BMFP domain-containing protein YqiC